MSDSGCFERPGKKLNKKTKMKKKMEKKMEKRVYMMQVILTREQFA